MKALITTGLSLALGLAAARSFAQDAPTRAMLPTLGSPAPAAAAAIIPVAYSAPPPATTSSGIGLGKPIAASGSSESALPADSLEYRPSRLTLERPIVRGQASDVPVQPLPVGVPLKQINGQTDGKGTGVPMPPAGKPAPNGSNFVPPMPRATQEGVPGTNSMNGMIVNGMPMTDMVMSGPVGDSCGCGCVTPTWSSARSGPAIIDGCGIVSMGDCGTGCFNDSCGCGCGCEDGCGFRGTRFYASAAYIGWAFQSKNLPPLVTVSPAGTARVDSGVLGRFTTATVFDQNNQENTFHSGGRFNFGFWMPGGNWGLEVDYLTLGQQSINMSFGSNGDPQFSRPAILSTNGQEFAQLVSFPGLLSGSVGVSMYSQMWGLELNAREKLFCGPNYWIDMLYGYRHLDLSEGIDIVENLSVVGGTQIVLNDQFHTRNVFNGPQIGIQGEYQFWNRFFVGGTFKLAAGNMHEQVIINGNNVTSTPGLPVFASNTGVFAQPTNIGSHTRDRFAVIPEANLKLGYDFNDHWRVWVGYDFLYASNVARPGDQIDRRITPAQVLGPLNPNPPPNVVTPAVLFRTTSFYAQGVSFGVQYRW